MALQVSRRIGRNTRGYRIALAIVLLLVTPGAFAASVRGAEPLVMQMSTPPSRSGTRIGRTNTAQQVSLAVPLKPLKQSALDSFLTNLSDPASPTIGATSHRSSSRSASSMPPAARRSSRISNIRASRCAIRASVRSSMRRGARHASLDQWRRNVCERACLEHNELGQWQRRWWQIQQHLASTRVADRPRHDEPVQQRYAGDV